MRAKDNFLANEYGLKPAKEASVPVFKPVTQTVRSKPRVEENKVKESMNTSTTTLPNIIIEKGTFDLPPRPARKAGKSKDVKTKKLQTPNVSCLGPNHCRKYYKSTNSTLAPWQVSLGRNATNSEDTPVLVLEMQSKGRRA